MEEQTDHIEGTTGRALEELNIAIRGVGNAVLEELIEPIVTPFLNAITRIANRMTK